MIEREYKIPFSWLDPKKRVKFSVLIELFQEAADADAAQFDISVPQLLGHGLTWVARKYRVNFAKYPTADTDTIILRSFAEPYRNLFSLRTYELYDGAGKLLGKSFTWWVLLDFKKMRPVRIDKCELMDPLRHQISSELPSDVKIPRLSQPTTEEVWKVRWLDMDVNNHTNNTVYFNWVLDTVPDNIPEDFAPVSVEGEFLKPIQRTKVRCLTQDCSDAESNTHSFIHSLRTLDDDVECAVFSSTWK